MGRERDPFTLISGFAIDMERLGSEANDGEGVESSAVCSHCDEVVCCGAVRVEHAFDDAIGKG